MGFADIIPCGCLAMLLHWAQAKISNMAHIVRECTLFLHVPLRVTIQYQTGLETADQANLHKDHPLHGISSNLWPCIYPHSTHLNKQIKHLL